MKRLLREAGRIVALVVLSFAALQMFFVARIALMIVVDPNSTAFQRSEAWRLLRQPQRFAWSHEWTDYERIAPALKRAVIASEDAGFADHAGIDWDAVEKAWERNARAQERADRANERLDRLAPRADAAPRRAHARVVGGSTITQQLAKNLFLSGERSLARKAQEFVIAMALEGLLDKRRILEIYLNNVEWGEGVFGAQAAARRYFGVDAARLGAWQAARLAVMLPAPKRFEKRPASAYIAGRASTILGRMSGVEVP